MPVGACHTPNQNMASNFNCHRSGLTSLIFTWKHKRIITRERLVSPELWNSNWMPYFDSVYYVPIAVLENSLLPITFFVVKTNQLRLVIKMPPTQVLGHHP